MVTIRTYRFPGDYATLSVHESAERSRVLVRMEGDRSQSEECSLFLAREQWNHLCTFDPFQGTADNPSVLRAVTFNDVEGDTLEVSQTWYRDSVQLVMRHNVSSDPDDCLIVSLDEKQWAELISLDLLEGNESRSMSRSAFSSRMNETIH
jgi:hypothetical protein